MGMTLKVTLPLGIQAPDGTWTKEIELEEMTGVEDDILADTRRVQVTTKGKKKGDPIKSTSKKFTEVLSRCTVRIGNCSRPDGQTRKSNPAFFESTWDKAFVADRATALIRLRQLSLGDSYKFSVECPHCHTELSRSVDLSELEVKEMPLAALSKNDGVFEKTLRNGRLVSWKILRGLDEPKMAYIVKERGADILTALITLHLVSYCGSEVSDEIIRDLSSSERRELPAIFDGESGGIDTELEIECSNEECGGKFSHRITPASPDFFFPSASQ